MSEIKDTSNNSNYITMVDRAIQIMDFIYKSNEAIGISHIASELDLPKANVFRILNTLEKWSLVEKANDTDKFILGRALVKYGEKAKSEIDLVSISSPIMKKLAKDIEETVNLGVLHQDSVLIIHSEEGESSILVSKLIPISPLNCSSMGKTFLTTFSDKKLDEYFKSDKVEKRTINTIIGTEEFKNEKKGILSTGIAYDREEYEYGLTCIASPIRDKNGNIIAAISISGPTTRLTFKGMETIEEKLHNAADAISESIDYI